MSLTDICMQYVHQVPERERAMEDITIHADHQEQKHLKQMMRLMFQAK